MGQAGLFVNGLIRSRAFCRCPAVSTGRRGRRCPNALARDVPRHVKMAELNRSLLQHLARSGLHGLQNRTRRRYRTGGRTAERRGDLGQHLLGPEIPHHHDETIIGEYFSV